VNLFGAHVLVGVSDSTQQIGKLRQVTRARRFELLQRIEHRPQRGILLHFVMPVDTQPRSKERFHAAFSSEDKCMCADATLLRRR
jgi:hypothetical protein